MALASENDNSKIVEIVTVAHVDNQKHVDSILVQIWKVILVIKLSLSTRFQSLVNILKLMFRPDFEAEVWSLFCCWCFMWL